MSGAELELAYQALVQRFVDPVDHRGLLTAATQALRTSLADQGVLPLFTLPLDLRPAPTGDPSRDWRAFATAYDSVVQKLPAWTAQARPDWLVVRAMVVSLADGHSYFRTPEEVQRDSDPSYGGIGVGLAPSDHGDGPLVLEVFTSSPAEKAGLKKGDRIVAVDGADLRGQPLAQVVQRIRGQTGSDVVLRVRRLTAPQPLDVRVTRGQVQVDPVTLLLSADGSLGYLRVRNFGSNDIASSIEGALRAGTRAGVRGWVLDLRGNPGGAITAVQSVAGDFLDNRSLGSEVDRQGQRTPIPAQGPALISKQPVVVLVDKDTASGAEMLAAALRDYGVAQVVGTSTAGNAEIATSVDLADGSRLQVTVRRYETSQGVRLDRTGVTPDIAVEQRDADLEAGRDTQLVRATQAVQAVLAQRPGPNQSPALTP